MGVFIPALNAGISDQWIYRLSIHAELLGWQYVRIEGVNRWEIQSELAQKSPHMAGLFAAVFVTLALTTSQCIRRI